MTAVGSTAASGLAAAGSGAGSTVAGAAGGGSGGGEGSARAAGRGGALRQSWVMAVRALTLLLRDPGPAVNSAVAPAFFFLGFLVPLREVMEARGIDYEQYMPPAVTIQAMFFVAISSADLMARDINSGMLTRVSSMPVTAVAGVAGRLVADAVRALLALAVTTGIALAIGFRFERGIGPALVYLGLLLCFGLGLCLLFDAIAGFAAHPEHVAAMLMLPQMLLVMLSTGFVPTDGFPGWMQPWVAHQPVSALLGALRDLSASGGGWGELAPAAGWLAGLWVLGGLLAARAYRRRAW